MLFKSTQHNSQYLIWYWTHSLNLFISIHWIDWFLDLLSAFPFTNLLNYSQTKILFILQKLGCLILIFTQISILHLKVILTILPIKHYFLFDFTLEILLTHPFLNYCFKPTNSKFQEIFKILMSDYEIHFSTLNFLQRICFDNYPVFFQ